MLRRHPTFFSPRSRVCGAVGPDNTNSVTPENVGATNVRSNGPFTLDSDRTLSDLTSNTDYRINDNDYGVNENMVPYWRLTQPNPWYGDLASYGVSPFDYCVLEKAAEQTLRELPRILAAELPCETSRNVTPRRLLSIPVESPHFPVYSLQGDRRIKTQLYIGVMVEPAPERADGATSRLQMPIGRMPRTIGGMDTMEYPM